MSAKHPILQSSNHLPFMRHALRLAERNLGQTWPNPAVGAVVVKSGQIIGTGWTARGGRPHAEPLALAQAGEAARGATLYVTLEPCSHHGKTPPCAEAIIEAGISRVVVGCVDANPQVKGGGIAALQHAGIEVVTGVCEEQARALNEGFFSVVERGRPFVGLKIATSQDGKIAFADSKAGEAIRWITGEKARAYGHLLRSRYDAILTGSGTVLADDPLLTCRLPGLEDRSPVRVVLDRRGQVPESTKLYQNLDRAPLWVERDYADLPSLLQSLAQRGITRVLVEAGAALSTAFLRAELVDRLYRFQAPCVIGAEGKAAIEGAELDEMINIQHFTSRQTLSLGIDRLYVLERA